MYRSRGSNWTLRVSLVAVFTALITVATASFSVSVPATKGYFNIGETAIYVAALLFGAYIGGLSAGLGSMISDLILGYALYAPATLVVKGLEGAIVGSLSGVNPHARWNPKQRSLLVVAASVVLTSIIFIVGSTYYAGLVEFSLASPLTPMGFSVTVPIAFWVALSLIALVAVLYFSLKHDLSLAWQIVTVLAGGAEMVVGYFLYEQLILGAAAIIEVPINTSQMMIGAVVAIPLVRAIKGRIPKMIS
jgi:uncharacterized membrane protein